VDGYRQKCQHFVDHLEKNPGQVPLDYIRKFSERHPLDPTKIPNHTNTKKCDNQFFTKDTVDKSEFLMEYFNSNPRIVKHIKGGNALQKKKLLDWLKNLKGHKPSSDLV
jgi:hypothetical protein